MQICESCCNKTCSRGLFSEATRPCYQALLSSSVFIFFVLELLALKMNTAGAVLDLERTLQNSKYIEPEKLQQHFRPSGK
jgi:hypothetical protein